MKEREKTDPAKAEKVNFHPSISGVRTMLNLYSAHTAYRGVPTTARQQKAHETKTVTMNYRGMVYTKQVEVAK